MSNDLQFEIQDAVWTANHQAGRVLSDEKVIQLTEDLATFVETAIVKYIKGQLEHGGNISDRDLDNEIDQEVIDLFFYQQARKRKAS